MEKNKISLAILIFGVAVSSVIVASNLSFAQDDASSGLAGVTFPVAELGGCQNKSECKSFCEKPENQPACFSFAEKNNLMDKEQIREAKKFLSAVKTPGNCKTKEECDAYCDNVDHINECISFAEQNGIAPKKDLAEAKKIQSAINKGIKMPACKNRQECDAYCSKPDHMEECITFAKEAGILDPQEQEEAQKVLAAVKKGVKAPACNGKKACDAYCSQEEHFEECITFAEAAGFVSKEEAEMARKSGGKGPGGCRGKEECQAYCDKEEHMQECVDFAQAHDLMSKEDVEIFKKTGGKGPGGCKSKETCDAFCNNPDNEEACFNFGKEKGILPESAIKEMEEGRNKMMEAFRNSPPEIADCFKTQLGAEKYEQLSNGTAMPNRGVGEVINNCYGRTMGNPGQGSSTPVSNKGGNGLVNSNMPDSVKFCLEKKFGNIDEKIMSGELTQDKIMQESKNCSPIPGMGMPPGQGFPPVQFPNGSNGGSSTIPQTPGMMMPPFPGMQPPQGMGVPPQGMPQEMTGTQFPSQESGIPQGMGIPQGIQIPQGMQTPQGGIMMFPPTPELQ